MKEHVVIEQVALKEPHTAVLGPDAVELTSNRLAGLTPLPAPLARTPRRRDASDTRARLLAAATDLFDERGFDRATVRDIAERAGVDPALIARYFGGKTELYIQALYERGDARRVDLLDDDVLPGLLAGSAMRRPGPILQAAVREHDDAKAQSAAVAQLHEGLIRPLIERFEREGRPDAELRAELIVAAYVGISLSRSVGVLTHLADADTDDLAPLVQAILSAQPPA
jgi:AcrR family transcriptional regulator